VANPEGLENPQANETNYSQQNGSDGLIYLMKK